jgi:hypothetical protein
MLFKIRNLPSIVQEHYGLFQYGELYISIRKSSTTNTTNIIITYNYRNYILTAVNNYDTYYLYISQDKDEKSAYSNYTNTLYINCVSKNQMQCNPANIFSSITDKKTGFAVNNYNSVWATPADGYKFIIGGMSRGLINSAEFDVGWLRIFDYVMEAGDITKDINNTWQRNWFNSV